MLRAEGGLKRRFELHAHQAHFDAFDLHGWLLCW
jgi:hypothetical protein